MRQMRGTTLWKWVLCKTILGGHRFEAWLRPVEKEIYAPPCTVCGNPNNPNLWRAGVDWYKNTENVPVERRRRDIILGGANPRRGIGPHYAD